MRFTGITFFIITTLQRFPCVLRKGDWKLIETFDPESVELYHLGRDLSESTNIAARETAKLLELRQDLAEWRQQVGAERMEPNPDYREQ